MSVAGKNISIRDVSGMVKLLREFLLGRKYTNALRFPPFVATRSPPLPEIPDGPSHKLSDNYYFTRDGRREIKPPGVIYSQNLLGSGESSVAAKLPRPGKVHIWD
ncbi:NADH dehydrogenase [ubiquinone] 1 alpha subcomplex subunit 7-like [Chrysoperla carnea]|uniref:NADH dehydrogenase [ubiquinone] 1 alpha subcomplex subunit 7-like n=1 Tax=Chrysoperla carnea TaxID=189513 RepID=UPI001D083F0E|nr:NADH dehydrogenase [ubiquinone] 1 alpha subcomplex subunit 7-like [Chrysoperla carnea]